MNSSIRGEEYSYFQQKLDNNIFLYKKILLLLGIGSVVFLLRNILFFTGVDALAPLYRRVYLAGVLVTVPTYILLPLLYGRRDKRISHVFLIISCAAIFYLFVILSMLDSVYINDTDLTAYSIGLLLLGFMLRIDSRISALIFLSGMVAFILLVSANSSCPLSFESLIPLVTINVLSLYFSHIREDFFHIMYRDKRVMEKESLRDSLTGTYNRRFMGKELSRCMELKKNRAIPFSCLFIDIDFFKKINDEYGHQAGDDVLRQFASVLMDGVRASDRVVRFGGEEFVVILTDTDLPRARETAERFRQQIEKTRFSSIATAITASFGIAEATAEDNVKTIIKRADSLLYRAKSEGRNRCCG